MELSFKQADTMHQNSAPQNLSPKDVAPHIYKWSREELEQMQAMIAGQLHNIRQSDRSEEKRPEQMPADFNRPPVEWNPF